MSDRLTPDWVETSGDAFGTSGIIGDKGEAMVYELLCKLFGNENVKFNQSDKHKQTQGKDFEVLSDGHWCGIDVKTNYHPEYGNVLVDVNKIRSSQALYWFHINLKDPSEFVCYPVRKMREYIKENNVKIIYTGQGPCYSVPDGIAKFL